MFSPINRILIDHYNLAGSFLIISAILLNLIPCGLVMRPVPIEPAEMAKKKKKRSQLGIPIKESFTNNTTQITLVDMNGDGSELKTEKKKKEKKSLKETLRSFIDFSLFYDVLFMFFAASNFLTSLGFNAPYIFIVDQAISLGIEKRRADFLVSTIGESRLDKLYLLLF